MFALLALICFVVKLFGGNIGSIDLVVLGLAFIAAHLLVGLWPFGGALPWRRGGPPAA